jgi:hypothetical protein
VALVSTAHYIAHSSVNENCFYVSEIFFFINSFASLRFYQLDVI